MMISNFINFQISYITFTILLANLLLSNGENAKYTSCSIPYSCGHVQNVGYPFWGDNRPDFCGIPGFNLKCYNGQSYPSMFVGLSVFGINESSHTMFISQDKLLGDCHLQALVRNKTIISMLKPHASVSKIRLFYGCLNCASRYKSKSYTCSNNNDGTNGSVYYFGNPSDISRIGKSSCSCKRNVTFLIDKRGLDELGSTTNESLLSILTKWPIEMEYGANFTACSKCEESGGRCGSLDEPSSDQFVCYCRDGARPFLCTQSGGRRKLIILCSGAAALVLGTILSVAVIRVMKRRSTNEFSFLWTRRTIGDQSVAAFLKSYGSLAPKRYTYAHIRKMTNSFNDKLGEGGYGSVYKGKLHDGRFVAVKKLKKLKRDPKDFINEVISISRTNHVNVVTLLGFCFEGHKRALVFEFLSNGSLEKFIYGREIGQSLQSETMFNIAIGIAKGLDYLHRGCNTRILHFDIKPHNILLDEEFCPKISDFGLARLCSTKNSMLSMSEARGTIGYIAPEVFCRNFGGVSHKSDVYSYGMMLLDLVCGRKNIPSNAQCSIELYFPEWIYNQLESMEETAVHGITNEDRKELERKMILVSLWCIQSYPSNRPPMNRVVEMFEGPLESIEMPPKPHLSSPTRFASHSSPMISK